MATSSRHPPHHESPRTARHFQESSRLRRPASLTSGNTIQQGTFVRKHTRGHSLAFLQQSPYPPYHGVPRDYRMAMVGQSFPIMGSSLYRGYTKPNRQTANSARHAEKSKSKEKQKSKGDRDKGNVEHSFITNSSEIAEMQGDLLTLQDDFNSGKLQAFDEQCSFEKMDNIRDLQEKLARLHFRMDEKLQAEGLHPTETIEVANENMDHLLSNVLTFYDSLIPECRGSLHPPRDEVSFPPPEYDHRI
ncbi:putative coiled-coil domain-containing protein [Apostichopus japonicus]|uniref:Putative coiled-coil domain-containing protein n=1 Tax=Stichopus japonicus TaxID=307972 RepID=A0A2G8KQQ2_STIJA|nr:putative coiled-coil domain-containing protein [Apostichopus japonicus]